MLTYASRSYQTSTIGYSFFIRIWKRKRETEASLSVPWPQQHSQTRHHSAQSKTNAARIVMHGDTNTQFEFMASSTREEAMQRQNIGCLCHLYPLNSRDTGQDAPEESEIQHGFITGRRWNTKDKVTLGKNKYQQQTCRPSRGS